MDRVVLITGGSSGIGAATAKLFAKNGFKVAISYKTNESGARKVAEELKKAGSETLVVQANLNSDAEAKNLVKSVLKKFGKMDVLVNNAGRYVSGDDWEGEFEVWEESIKQNLLSNMSVSKYVIQEMKKRKSGVIVNVSSRYSLSGEYEAPAYAASKAAIVNLTQGQAKLMAPWGRANTVSPGVTRAGYWLKATEEELESNMEGVPLQKIVEPEDIAKAIYFLSSEKAKMITGQNLVIDGGYTI